jgi:hypothetical protein
MKKILNGEIIDMTVEEIAEWEASNPIALPADDAKPPALTRRQLRLGLLSIGLTNDDIETHIASIEEPSERAAALIEWQDASSYERDHPVLVDVATALGLPPEQVDALWLWAAGL